MTSRSVGRSDREVLIPRDAWHCADLADGTVLARFERRTASPVDSVCRMIRVEFRFGLEATRDRDVQFRRCRDEAFDRIVRVCKSHAVIVADVLRMSGWRFGVNPTSPTVDVSRSDTTSGPRKSSLHL